MNVDSSLSTCLVLRTYYESLTFKYVKSSYSFGGFVDASGNRRRTRIQKCHPPPTNVTVTLGKTRCCRDELK